MTTRLNLNPGEKKKNRGLRALYATGRGIKTAAIFTGQGFGFGAKWLWDHRPKRKTAPKTPPSSTKPPSRLWAGVKVTAKAGWDLLIVPRKIVTGTFGLACFAVGGKQLNVHDPKPFATTLWTYGLGIPVTLTVTGFVCGAAATFTAAKGGDGILDTIWNAAGNGVGSAWDGFWILGSVAKSAYIDGDPGAREAMSSYIKFAATSYTFLGVISRFAAAAKINKDNKKVGARNAALNKLISDTRFDADDIAATIAANGINNLDPVAAAMGVDAFQALGDIVTESFQNPTLIREMSRAGNTVEPNLPSEACGQIANAILTIGANNLDPVSIAQALHQMSDRRTVPFSTVRGGFVATAGDLITTMAAAEASVFSQLITQGLENAYDERKSTTQPYPSLILQPISTVLKGIGIYYLPDLVHLVRDVVDGNWDEIWPTIKTNWKAGLMLTGVGFGRALGKRAQKSDEDRAKEIERQQNMRVDYDEDPDGFNPSHLSAGPGTYQDSDDAMFADLDGDGDGVLDPILSHGPGAGRPADPMDGTVDDMEDAHAKSREEVSAGIDASIKASFARSKAEGDAEAEAVEKRLKKTRAAVAAAEEHDRKNQPKFGGGRSDPDPDDDPFGS